MGKGVRNIRNMLRNIMIRRLICFLIRNVWLRRCPMLRSLFFSLTTMHKIILLIRYISITITMLESLTHWENKSTTAPARGDLSTAVDGLRRRPSPRFSTPPGSSLLTGGKEKQGLSSSRSNFFMFSPR
jgi:hypothetical protein